MRILTIVGARPQFIKAAVVSRLVANRSDIDEILVHTGQHYDAAMSDVFFDELDLPHPEYSLNIGSGSQAGQTGRMMIEIERVLQEDEPDAVLVYGDTNSTIAAALAAAKLCIPVAHVEAGLRSFDRTMPEEVNRCVTDHLSKWFFCPTNVAVSNLRAEGITDCVYHVGDVMHDALLNYRDSTLSEAVSDQLPAGDLILCTLHRAGNTDDIERFTRIWQAINRLSEELPIVLPVHPRTRKVIDTQNLKCASGLQLIEPVGYRDMLVLQTRAKLIVTDSGGLQKEAYLQKVPCLTLRENTEWVETVEVGWNRIVGHNTDLLLSAAREFLKAGPPTEHPELYGDGHAGERILDHLVAEVPERANSRGGSGRMPTVPDRVSA